MLIDVSWAGSRTCAAPVLRLGQPLLADNVRRPQHPDTGCWHWRHVHEIPLCLLSSACRQIPGGGKGSKSDGDWDTLMLELAELKQAVVFFFSGTKCAQFRPSEGEIWEGKQPFFHPALQWQKCHFWVTRDSVVQSSMACGGSRNHLQQLLLHLLSFLVCEMGEGLLRS